MKIKIQMKPKGSKDIVESHMDFEEELVTEIIKKELQKRVTKKARILSVEIMKGND